MFFYQNYAFLNSPLLLPFKRTFKSYSYKASFIEKIDEYVKMLRFKAHSNYLNKLLKTIMNDPPVIMTSDENQEKMIK